MRKALHRRRVLTMFLSCLLSTLAFAADERYPGDDKWTEFDREVAKSIYRALPRSANTAEADGFVLLPQSIARSNSPPVEPRAFVFVGADMNPIRLECERGTILRIASRHSVEDGISVGLCGRERTQVQAIVDAAPSAVQEIKKQMAKSFGTEEKILTQGGLYFNSRKLADGARQYFVPLPYMTNRSLVIESVILIDDAGAWIVQAQLSFLCDRFATAAIQPHRLCTGTEETLGAMAQEIRAAFPK